MIDFKKFCEIKWSLMRAGMDEIEAHQIANDRVTDMSVWLNTPNVDDSDFAPDNTEEEGEEE